MCDVWPTESVWAWVKNKLVKRQSQHAIWRHGIGHQHWIEMGEGAGLIFHCPEQLKKSTVRRVRTGRGR